MEEPHFQESRRLSYRCEILTAATHTREDDTWLLDTGAHSRDLCDATVALKTGFIILPIAHLKPFLLCLAQQKML